MGTGPDERREGDTRPWEGDPMMSLTIRPAENRPFRWLPKHGKPYCVGEWFTQHLVRAAPGLTLAIVVLSLILQILILVEVL